MAKKKTSEFGRGFIYNLCLFAKHFGQIREYQESYQKIGLPVERAFSLWMNGAGDHFFELEVPPRWQRKNIGKLALDLQKRALYYRMQPMTKTEVEKFFKDLSFLTMLIDKELGVKPIEATWS